MFGIGPNHRWKQWWNSCAQKRKTVYPTPYYWPSQTEVPWKKFLRLVYIQRAVKKYQGLVILTSKWYTRAFKSSVLEDLLRWMWAQGECVELLWLTYFAGRLVPNKKCHHVLHLCIEDSTAAQSALEIIFSAMKPSDRDFHALFVRFPVFIVFSHVVLYLVFQ